MPRPRQSDEDLEGLVASKEGLLNPSVACGLMRMVVEGGAKATAEILAATVVAAEGGYVTVGWLVVGHAEALTLATAAQLEHPRPEPPQQTRSAEPCWQRTYHRNLCFSPLGIGWWCQMEGWLRRCIEMRRLLQQACVWLRRKAER